MEPAPVPLLLVEDDPEIREALGEYLDACGFAVTAVADGRTGLATALSSAPRLVICDLSLPDQRGDAFLIAFHVALPQCLLYVHSGDAGFSPSPELVRSGVTADHIFIKPADLTEMVARLRSHLGLTDG